MKKLNAQVEELQAKLQQKLTQESKVLELGLQRKLDDDPDGYDKHVIELNGVILALKD